MEGVLRAVKDEVSFVHTSEILHVYALTSLSLLCIVRITIINDRASQSRKGKGWHVWNILAGRHTGKCEQYDHS